MRATADPVEVLLEVEFGRLDTDDDQPLAGVLVCPGPHVGKGTDPVDAGVGAEADQDNTPPKGVGGHGYGIQPGGGTVEGGQVAFDGVFVAMTQHEPLRSSPAGISWLR